MQYLDGLMGDLVRKGKEIWNYYSISGLGFRVRGT